jgi:predicted DNA-binding transcriptional regulator YafY
MIDRNWDALKRPLLIINQLRQGPADKQTLIKTVRQIVPDAYPETSDKAQSRTFERDLENARIRLLATIEWQPRLRQYVLHDPGLFARSDLPPEALTSLAFLKDSFTTSEEIQRVIRPLLDWVEQAIPTEQMRQMRHQQAPIQLNIQRISEGDIHPEVWRKVIYAIKQRRIIVFAYASPFHEKGEARRHTVEPYEHYLRNGHFYLKAYCLRWVAPNGFENGRFWANPYRLDHILPDDLELLGTFAPRQQPTPQQQIRYKLSPRIVRGGISRYFSAMTVSEPDADGWVEVTAHTDNEFEAFRTLLTYADQCLVLAPPSLVERMKQVTQSFRTFYGETAPSLPANETE